MRTPYRATIPEAAFGNMFLLGHSHVVSLEHGAAMLHAPYRSLNLWGFGRPLLYDGPDAPRLEPKLAAMLDDFVVSAIGGSAHDMVGLVQHPRRFDFVLAETPDLPIDPSAELIPQSAIALLLRNTMQREQLDLVRALVGRGRRVVHMESPPPVADTQRLSEEMGCLAFVPQPNQGASSAWLRYKLWRVHSAIVRLACEEAGVEFFPVPAAAMEQGRFLRPELQGYPCHANDEFGLLMMKGLLGVEA